ncbi:unnamed protein product, partial [Ectocarpus fasciculatus]
QRWHGSSSAVLLERRCFTAINKEERGLHISGLVFGCCTRIDAVLYTAVWAQSVMLGRHGSFFFFRPTMNRRRHAHTSFAMPDPPCCLSRWVPPPGGTKKKCIDNVCGPVL